MAVGAGAVWVGDGHHLVAFKFPYDAAILAGAGKGSVCRRAVSIIAVLAEHVVFPFFLVLSF